MIRRVTCPVTQGLIDEAVGHGARFVLTPEVTNCVSTSRAHQAEVLQPEESDMTLTALRAQAARQGIWLLIGVVGAQIRRSGPAFREPVIPHHA